MSNGQPEPGTDRMAVAECPDCGLVADEALDFRFPNPSVCNKCGSEVVKTVIADATEVARHV